jgi:hypothetical protein
VTDHECPACGRTFETRRGVGVHHYHAHGEHLPNRNCRHCGQEFYCKHEKKYCSNECRDEATSFEGSNNPNYRDGTESTECLICGDEFEYYPSNRKGMYCSDCVERTAWRDPPVPSGSENTRWRETVELECSVCGDPIERFPSEVTGKVAVCSEDCRSEWLSD